MAKFYFLILGLALGVGMTKLIGKTPTTKDTRIVEEIEHPIPPKDVTINNCEDEISKAKFSLLYKTLDIDSKALIKGANGVPFNDPRMFVEMMNGLTRGDLCVEYVKNGHTGTNCIQRKVNASEVADSKETVPAQKGLQMGSTRTIDRDVTLQTEDDDTILSELLAKKGLIPVRSPQTGDITGYTKVTK